MALMRHIIAFSMCFLCAAEISTAQTNTIVPAQFQQFFKVYPLINPASMAIHNDIGFMAGDKSLLGVFKGTRTFYANFYYNISKPGSDNRKNVIGCTFINDKEGSYIDKNQAMLSYAIHIPVKKSLIASAGASLGFVNYSFNASMMNAGGSSFAPNGDVGIWLHDNKFNAGVSVNQLFGGALQPLRQYYHLTRYINVNLDRVFFINADYSLMPSVSFRWVNEEYYNLDIAGTILYRKILSGGLGMKYQRGLLFYMGLEKIDLGSADMKVMVSYYNTFNKKYLYEVQSLELSLNFSMNKNE
jgi:type IX secretion system PorP/SprF family membrane protein